MDDDAAVGTEEADGAIDANDTNGEATERVAGERISSPRKVMRIMTMLKQLLDETRNIELDDNTRQQIITVQDVAVKQILECLSPDLQDELGEFITAIPDANLRIKQAQLVGWLEGLMHGIQTTLVTTKDKEKKKPDPDNRPGQYL